MAKTNLLFPLGNEHKLYESVMTGKRHIWIKLERIEDLREEGETEESLAQDMYRTDLEAAKKTTGYYRQILTQEPVIDEETGLWVVRKILTTEGKKAYDALEIGLIWDTDQSAVNFDETIEYYDNMINNGRVEMRYVDLLINNTTPELKALKGRLVYFKMQGQRKNNEIVPL